MFLKTGAFPKKGSLLKRDIAAEIAALRNMVKDPIRNMNDNPLESAIAPQARTDRFIPTPKDPVNNATTTARLSGPERSTILAIMAGYESPCTYTEK